MEQPGLCFRYMHRVCGTDHCVQMHLSILVPLVLLLLFHLFVFHFGASVPTSSVALNPLWSTNSYREALTRVATYRSVFGLKDVLFLQSVLLSP